MNRNTNAIRRPDVRAQVVHWSISSIFCSFFKRKVANCSSQTKKEDEEEVAEKYHNSTRKKRVRQTNVCGRQLALLQI